ncbi:SPFH domain-containing protein [Paenibacillus harenae]|uniref:Regulator of protease activity HflC (Stomatin/prohibitin superfamily) n=1 Tax=Paenibacillus harenae TaxID=306543 RepID=A0ABT9U6K0_PAEHA|nr:SPFH domain-containing protein [Paenibacillus harenae]MDQ0060643.1 regulator of protease activity HflC (stomatin/prohibitin superfamily) [Paenibacillus harenae]MDQ0115262.1 regulator of protease activity HflC (stomatin/prohibitin superfamily) [Paenibacillus harenae]
MGIALAFIVIVIVIVFAAMSVKIVPQQNVGVVERLGKFSRLLTPGINILIPFIDHVRTYHDLRIQQANVPPQTVITKDNVQVKIDTIIFYQVTGPEQATYGISDYVYGVRNISTATMRQIIGKMELDETLSGREKISTDIRIALDEATEKWGVRIERVEVIDIQPPLDIQEAMDKQMKAERSKRALVLDAEAAKQDMILRAEGDKQSKILKAEGDKEARIRHAEGQRQAQELEALGEAKAIQTIAEAERSRIELIRSAGLDDKVLTYRSLEALSDIANGAANKVFIPTRAVETLGSIGAISEMLKSNQ